MFVSCAVVWHAIGVGFWRGRLGGSNWYDTFVVHNVETSIKYWTWKIRRGNSGSNGSTAWSWCRRVPASGDKWLIPRLHGVMFHSKSWSSFKSEFLVRKTIKESTNFCHLNFLRFLFHLFNSWGLVLQLHTSCRRCVTLQKTPAIW